VSRNPKISLSYQTTKLVDSKNRLILSKTSFTWVITQQSLRVTWRGRNVSSSSI